MRAAVVAGTLALALLGGAGAAAQTVRRVTCAAEDGAVRVRVEADGPLRSAGPARFTEGRVTVALAGARVTGTPGCPSPPAPLRRVRLVRVGTAVEVRIDVRGRVRVDRRTDGARADVVVRPLGAGPAVVAAAPAAPAARPAGPRAAPPGADEPDLDRLLGAGAARWRLDTIVLDAGHGGHDTGALAHGVREKDVTLGVARKLGALLETLPGVRVVHTRAGDRFVALKDRGTRANEAGGKLFVSLHANAMPAGGTARGAETYFLGLHRSASAQTVMERENAVVRLEGDPAAYARFDDEQHIVQALAGSAYLRTSERLAGLIQRQFADRAGRPSRGVKQAGFYVLWGASMPAVLVELGFLTDRDEAAFLASDTGQDLLASAIFRAVRDLKTQYERGLE